MAKARSNKKPSRKSNKLGVLSALVVIVLVAIGAYFVLHKKPTVAVTANQYTKGEPTSETSGNSSSSQTSSGASSSTANGKGSSSTDTSAPLIAPTGDFVSDHEPNLSGSPNPSSMTSVCNTSPGATCQIYFTMGSTQKSLPAQATDAGGSTYWSWNLKDVGLTAGSWTVKAVSTLGSQSQTTTDSLQLDVSQ